MDYKIIERLQNLGLKPNETKVYSALLELGQGTVSEISKTAQLNRTTGYDILERLAIDGLVNRLASGKKINYIVEPPIRLKQYLENKKHQAERRLDEAGDVIPELQNLYKKENKPVIKFFEGREGIKNIYWHTLEAKSVIYSILDLSQYLPEFEQFGKDYIRERSKRGIKEKVLALKNEKGLAFYNSTYKNNKDFQKYAEYKWLDKQFAFSPAAEVNIYGDVVMGVLFKPGENAAFEIKNYSFANSLKIIFEIAWEKSKAF